MVFFLLLIKVIGIVHKAAIAILSSMPTDILTFAILSEDTKTIQKAQGIGAKTAKKLVLELKDKVGIIKTPQNTGSEIYDNAALTIGINSEIKDEAVQVLTALGYSQTEAVKAISTVEMYEEMTSEELVKLSLKNLM